MRHSSYLVNPVHTHSGFGHVGVEGLDRACVLHVYRRMVSSCLGGINRSVTVLLFCACLTALVLQCRCRYKVM